LRLVVDASTLVAELLRERGHRLISDPRLDLYVPALMWEETRHEVSKRLDVRVSRGSPEPVADIFTGDEDSFGCGVATWTVETLIAPTRAPWRVLLHLTIPAEPPGDAAPRATSPAPRD